MSDVMKGLEAALENLKPKEEEKETETHAAEAEQAEEQQGDHSQEGNEEESEGRLQEEEEKNEAPHPARLRIKAKEEEQKRLEAEARLQKTEEMLQALGINQAQLTKLIEQQLAAQQPKDAPKEEDLEPDIALYPEEWKEWNNRKWDAKLKDLEKRYEPIAQEQEFKRKELGLQFLEKQYESKQPDYRDAKNFIVNKYKESLRLQYPMAADYEIEAATKKWEIEQAEQTYLRNYDPAKMFYEAAQKFGYTQPSPATREEAAQKDETDAPKGPNLQKLREIKGRAKSTVGTGNSGESRVDARNKALSIFDLAKLDQKTLYNMTIGKLEQ